MDDRYYLTTAIFYPSPAPALHSLFEAIGADAIARYHRLHGRGHPVPDRHGRALGERRARRRDEQGVEPRDLVDPWAATWRAAFDRFGISYDRFIRTTDPDHARASTEMVRRAHGRRRHLQGHLRRLVLPGRQRVQDRCADRRRPLPRPPDARAAVAGGGELLLRACRATRSGSSSCTATTRRFCEPEHFRNEVLGWLSEGLRDFSISRAGGTWGIPFPGDPEHRIYVWFDALTNYLTGAGFPDDRGHRSSAGGRPTCTSSARTSRASTASTGRRC